MTDGEMKPDQLQPNLNGKYVAIKPLLDSDFELLFKVASDPEIWEQHPNKDRYKREVFRNFFDGAIESNGAFLVLNNETGEPIGSTRYYAYNREKNSVAIGYTFLAKEFWGTTHNRALKILMLDHAFEFVDKVFFHIGANNIRSQKAILKLGAEKIEEKDIAYYGEESNLNFVYIMKKNIWEKIRDEKLILN